MYEWNKEPHQHKKRGSRHSTKKVEKVHGPELKVNDNSEFMKNARNQARELSEKAEARRKKEKEEYDNPPRSIGEEAAREAAIAIAEAKAKRARQNTNFTTETHMEQGFYGHVQASDFKRTSIVSTTGRVR